MKSLLFLFILFCTQAVFAENPPAQFSVASEPPAAQTLPSSTICTDATFDELKSAYNELEGLLNEAQENPAPFKNMDLVQIQRFVEETGELKQTDFSENDALQMLDKINTFNNELATHLLE